MEITLAIKGSTPTPLPPQPVIGITLAIKGSTWWTWLIRLHRCYSVVEQYALRLTQRLLGKNAVYVVGCGRLCADY